MKIADCRLPIVDCFAVLAWLIVASAQAFAAESLLLSGATVHTVTGATFSPGQVLVKDGKIAAVGVSVNAPNARLVDLKGLHLFPGLIAPSTSLGLVEIDAVRATRDMTESGDYHPEIQSWLAVNPDSAARGCLRSTYDLITIDDAKALAPTIVQSIQEMAPANTMFSKGVRLAGIKALARLKIEEGIPLTLMMMKLTDWGKGYIVTTSLDVLKEYRGSAKSILPELKKLEADFRNMKAEHAKLLEVMALIENDNNPPKLISLKEYVDKGSR